MTVTIYTPKNKLLENLSVISVLLPGTLGLMQIFKNHIPIITTLRQGQIVIETENQQTIHVDVDNGYVQFSENIMTIVIEKTSLTTEQLEQIQQKAISLKDKDIRKEENISEDDFRASHK